MGNVGSGPNVTMACAKSLRSVQRVALNLRAKRAECKRTVNATSCCLSSTMPTTTRGRGQGLPLPTTMRTGGVVRAIERFAAMSYICSSATTL